MACTFEKDLLSAYHDDELDVREREQVDSHLKSCEECRRELEDVRAVSMRLQSAGRARAPESLKAGVQDRISGPRLVRKPLRHRRVLELSLAAAAAVLVAVTAVVMFQPPEDPDSQPVMAKGQPEERKAAGSPDEPRKNPGGKAANPTIGKAPEEAEAAPGPEKELEEEIAKAKNERGRVRPGRARGRAVPDEMKEPAAPPGAVPEAVPGAGEGRGGRAPAPAKKKDWAKGKEEKRSRRGAAEGSLTLLVVGSDDEETNRLVNEFLREHTMEYHRPVEGEWTCTLSKADTEKLVEYLRTKGSPVVESDAPADVVGGMIAKLSRDLDERYAGDKAGRRERAADRAPAAPGGGGAKPAEEKANDRLQGLEAQLRRQLEQMKDRKSEEERDLARKRTRETPAQKGFGARPDAEPAPAPQQNEAPARPQVQEQEKAKPADDSQAEQPENIKKTGEREELIRVRIYILRDEDLRSNGK